MTSSLPLEGSRVLIVLKHFMLGGLERVVQMHVGILMAAGADVEVYVLENDRDNCLVAELPVQVRVHARGIGARSLADLADGAIVFLELGDGSLYPEIRESLTGCRWLVRFCHSDYSHARTAAENERDRKLALGEDIVVAVGEQAKRFLVADVGVPEDRIRTIRNAVKPGPSEATTMHVLPGLISGRYVVAVQSLYAHKGHARLLRALAVANHHIEDPEQRVRVVCVGDGDQLLSLRNMAKQLDVAGDVIWAGGIWQRDIVERLLEDAHAFVSLSKAEGLPLSVLEAVRAGLPLVLSDIDAHRDASRDPSCLFVPGDDAEAVALALRTVWESPKKRQSPAVVEALGAEWRRFCDEVIACATGRPAP